MRVFLDANVLFSGSNAGSNMSRLLERLSARGTAVSSPLAVEEARRNLELKRPGWLADFDGVCAPLEPVRTRNLTHLVKFRGAHATAAGRGRGRGPLELVPAAQFALPVPLDTKDAPLLCAAIAAKCEYFVTGDRRDFGHLDGRTVMGVEIISPLRLAQLLAEKRRPS